MFPGEANQTNDLKTARSDQRVFKIVKNGGPGAVLSSPLHNNEL